MSIGTDDLRALILEVVPPDGTPIGNQSLLAALRQQEPSVSDAEFQAARDVLVADGELAKGRGRGGSVFRVTNDDTEENSSNDADTETNGDDGEDDDGEVDEFELEVQEAPAGTISRRGKKKSKKRVRALGAPTVLSYRHPDKRANNPEVGMVHPDNDPDQPKTVWKYDPHLDPALQFDSVRARVENLIDDALKSGDVERMREALIELKRLEEPYLTWTGKAERTSFDVDTVSLHVHERIDPASILAAIRKRMKGENDGGEKAFQPGLFDAPFENLPLRQALDFYRHEKNWSNRLIAGDSLLVMNSLLQKESMAGQVQMIYIDPPYGIKYGSNFQPFTNKRDVKDGADADLTQEPEMIKAFRDTWELGIHSYLTYLRDRLLLAKELLHESGSVFVQIGDENIHLVRQVLDEIVGADNFSAQIAFKATDPLGQKGVARVYDYLIWYAKSRPNMKFRGIFKDRNISEDNEYRFFDLFPGQSVPTERNGLPGRDAHF
jgi:adenine-specific DNA-methyltransferase